MELASSFAREKLSLISANYGIFRCVLSTWRSSATMRSCYFHKSKRLENSANFLPVLRSNWLLLVQNQVAHFSPMLNSLKSHKELDSYEVIFKQELTAIWLLVHLKCCSQFNSWRRKNCRDLPGKLYHCWPKPTELIYRNRYILRHILAACW